MRGAAVMTGIVLGAMVARADDPPPLVNNPFLRPGLVELTPADGTPPSPLELRAILSAGVDSLADVGGQIVRVGDEVSGYTLIAVSEDSALFERDGRSLRVPLPAHAPEPAATDPALQAKEADDEG